MFLSNSSFFLFNVINVLEHIQISARLQTLSKFNIECGSGRRQVEKGHAREFLTNTVNFDSTLAREIDRPNLGLSENGTEEAYSVSLLGVPVKPLNSAVQRMFEIALNGPALTPAVIATVEKESRCNSATTIMTDRSLDVEETTVR